MNIKVNENVKLQRTQKENMYSPNMSSCWSLGTKWSECEGRSAIYRFCWSFM